MVRVYYGIFKLLPRLGGLQIPDGLVVRSCTSHPGVLGSILIPERRYQLPVLATGLGTACEGCLWQDLEGAKWVVLCTDGGGI